MAAPCELSSALRILPMAERITAHFEGCDGACADEGGASQVLPMSFRFRVFAFQDAMPEAVKYG